MRKSFLPILLLCGLTFPLYALEINYQYDSLNRLTHVDYGKGQQTIEYVYDNAGNILSTNISVADQFPPNLQITSPLDGDEVLSSTLVISGTASDAGRGASGIASVLINGQAAEGAVVANAETANWSIETLLTYGANSLTVVTSDGSPFANKTSETIHISYQPPFVDSDHDDIDDHWENFYFSNLNAVNATTDADDDGVLDLHEYQANSHPNDARSRAVQIQLALKTGFQQLFYPLEEPVINSAFGLLRQLNSLGVAVSEIKALDPQTRIFQTAHMMAETGTLSGFDFALVAGQGVYAQITADSILPINGSVRCQSIDLFAGINIVGFQCLPVQYSAYQLLNAIGGQTMVQSIQKFDRLTGRFETATYEGNKFSGDDFLIKAGEAYIIHMVRDQAGFDPV